MSIKPFAFLLVSFLAGCVTIGAPTPTRTTFSDYPPVGVVTTAEVGAPMVFQQNMVEREGLSLLSDFDFYCEYPNPYKLRKGQFFEKQVTSTGSVQYCGRGALTALLGNQASHLLCLKKSDKGLWTSVGHWTDCATLLPVKEGFHTAIHSNNFQRRLVYNGRSGDSVFISYREFISDMARPAFSQNLTFDMKESRIFGFQGARFEIYGATNTEIEFRLLKTFPDREKP